MAQNQHRKSNLSAMFSEGIVWCVSISMYLFRADY